MKILICGYFAAFWHEEAWARALTEMGHEVAQCRFDPWFRSGVWGRIQKRFLVGPSIDKVNASLIHDAVDYRADVIVCYRALPIRPETIQELRYCTDATLVSYNNDNVFGPLKHKSYWRFFLEAIPSFDLHLVFRSSDIAHYQKMGAQNVQLLYHHYLPWLHRPIAVEQNDIYSSDICFLGHCERDRRLHELATLMRTVPVRYSIHGSSWQKYGKGQPWQQLTTEEVQGENYVRGLNGANIALAFFSTLNQDTYTTRVFEIPACGTFMLSQRTDTMLELYEEDTEAVYYRDAEELAEKAHYYLTHTARREMIAAAGRKRCLSSGYDIFSRMSEWLAPAEQLRGAGRFR